MKKIITILSLTVLTAIMLSSCIIVGSEDPEFVLTRAEKIDEDHKEPEQESSTSKKYSITCKNDTSRDIIDWCVKKDNKVTLPTSNFDRSIRAHGESKISGLDKGYYMVFFSFADEERTNVWQYSCSYSIELDRNATYCITEAPNSNPYIPVCKSRFYLSGSDGSKYELSLN